MKIPTSVWILVIAAGESQRFEGIKALSMWKNSTLIQNAIELANKVSGNNIHVILGCHSEEISPHLQAGTFSINKNWRRGMGSSIAHGFNEILQKSPNTDTIVILPIDQPLISESHILNLVAKAQSHQCTTLTCNSNGVIGPPAAVYKSHFVQTRNLNSEHGLKSILPEEDFLLVSNESALLDADTPSALENLR